MDYFSESIWFDLCHGTRTSSRVPKSEQSINSSGDDIENGLLYVASFTSVTKKTVECARSAIEPRQYEKSQFIDLGCGKGKALLVFAKFYGSEVEFPALGIEYDRRLANIAKWNIEKCKFREVDIIVKSDSALNLLNYVKGKFLIVYLYNSFQGSTLKKVLDLLKDISHILIYVDPVEKDLLSNYNYTILKENIGKYNADTWLVAKSK